METFKYINFAIALIFFVCYSYQFFFIAVPFLKRAKPHKEAKANRFAVLVCARNEENVIADLLDSLQAQTYTAAPVTVFVIADNCTDNTAAIARERGAVVYERFDKRLVGKGYALEQLLRHIGTDYPEQFDGFFVFDADNILEPDYIENMNKTFSDGFEIVTGYRNSKNYGDNWISAGYGLWFLRESRFLNHSRFLLGTSSAIGGTGFLFSRRVLESTNGWHFHLLTEDIQFTVHHILEDTQIGFCPDARLYDEQPVLFRQSWRQRLRWAKGYLQVFRHYGFQLMRGALKRRFACFDMSMAIMPAIVLTSVSIISNIIFAFFGAAQGESLLITLQSITETLVNMYLTLFGVGLVTTISEWKHIRTTSAKKLFYTITFPLFMFTYIPISFTALFAKVEWKPIEHNVRAVALRK